MTLYEPLRISIVTPSLNQGRFLREALLSVERQGYPAYEHFVFDGGSKDDSAALLKDFAERSTMTRFTWQSQEDAGQSAALNDGFQQATGDIVGWLNADDRYRPGCLAQVAAFFTTHPDVDLIYGDYSLIDEAGQHLDFRREIEFSSFVLNYHRVLYIPTTSTFFRRRIVDHGHLLRTDLHYAMDLEFFVRLARAGYKFQHVSYVLADFRIHPLSKSISARAKHRAEHWQITLSSTPLADWIHRSWARIAVAIVLRLAAACLRYAEKLMRGYYFPNRRITSPTLAEIGDQV